MKKRKSRAYYQYMLDLADNRVGYYSTDDISLIAYDLLDDGDEEEALSACEKGLDQHPGDEFVLIVKAKVLARMRRVDESDRLLTGNPDEQTPFGISVRFSILAQREGDLPALNFLLGAYRQDQVLLQEAIDILDEHFDMLGNSQKQAFLCSLFDDICNRQPDGTKGGKDEDSLAESLGRIGAMLMDCNCHEQAIAVLEKALDIDAYDIYSWQDLARCLFARQQYQECTQACEMGLAIDPNNPFFNYAMGAIRFIEQHLDECISYLEKARQFFEGKIRHEETHLDQTELNNQRDNTYEMLGNAYESVGQTARSIECYQQLIVRQPALVEIHYRLARLYARIGDLQNARNCAYFARVSDPANEEYKQFYNLLNNPNKS